MFIVPVGDGIRCYCHKAEKYIVKKYNSYSDGTHEHSVTLCVRGMNEKIVIFCFFLSP